MNIHNLRDFSTDNEFIELILLTLSNLRSPSRSASLYTLHSSPRGGWCESFDFAWALFGNTRLISADIRGGFTLSLPARLLDFCSFVLPFSFACLDLRPDRIRNACTRLVVYAICSLRCWNAAFLHAVDFFSLPLSVSSLLFFPSLRRSFFFPPSRHSLSVVSTRKESRWNRSAQHKFSTQGNFFPRCFILTFWTLRRYGPNAMDREFFNLAVLVE